LPTSANQVNPIIPCLIHHAHWLWSSQEGAAWESAGLAEDPAAARHRAHRPWLELVEERSMLKDWGARKSPEDLEAYRAEKNAVSIDGLPAL
jgi:hypothetical protein